MGSTKTPLIVGIDPGTTTAWAAIDPDGAFLAAASGKELGLPSLLAGVISHGLPLIIATDKAKTPSFVRAAAAKTGARLWHPKADLLQAQKRLLAPEKLANDHEHDALAAARAAQRHYHPLILKARKATATDPAHFPKLLAGILKDPESSIAEQLAATTKTDEPKTPRRSPRQRRLPLLRNPLSPPPPDLQEDRSFHTLQAARLAAENRYLREALRAGTDRELLATLRSLEERLAHEQAQRQRLAKILQAKDAFLDRIIPALAAGKTIVCRKAPSLSNAHIKALLASGPLPEGSALLVDDAAIIGDEALRSLRGKIAIIIHRRPLAQKNKRESFIYVPAHLLTIDEDDRYALIDKDALARAVRGSDLLRSVLADYKKERY